MIFFISSYSSDYAAKIQTFLELRKLLVDYFLKYRKAEVYGIDISEESVEKAKKVNAKAME
jgi:hypothetical protein